MIEERLEVDPVARVASQEAHQQVRQVLGGAHRNSEKMIICEIFSLTFVAKTIKIICKISLIPDVAFRRKMVA